MNLFPAAYQQHMNVSVMDACHVAWLGVGVWRAVTSTWKKVGVSWNVDVDRERRRGKQASTRTSNVRVDTKRRRENAS